MNGSDAHAVSAALETPQANATLRAEADALRIHLARLAAAVDPDLAQRYALRHQPLPPGLYWKLRRLAARVHAAIEPLLLGQRNGWPAAIKRTGRSARAKPVLIWAVGADRDTLRAACRGLAALDELRRRAPVLVTDVADFAFFSRLGWLVEYLPRLAGDGEPYDLRKARFLARLYHGAPVLPVRAGLETSASATEIRRLIRGRA